LKELKLALLTSIQEQSENESLQISAGEGQDLPDKNRNKEPIAEAVVSEEQQIDPNVQPDHQELERVKEKEKKRKELLTDLKSRYENEEESIDSIGSKNIKSDLLEAMDSMDIPVDMLGDITCQHTSCKVEFVLEDIQKGGPLLQLQDEAPGEQIFDITQNDDGQSIVTSYFARKGFNLKGDATED
jgi:molecular chaperone GrpE (heat shock protein)